MGVRARGRRPRAVRHVAQRGRRCLGRDACGARAVDFVEDDLGRGLRAVEGVDDGRGLQHDPDVVVRQRRLGARADRDARDDDVRPQCGDVPRARTSVVDAVGHERLHAPSSADDLGRLLRIALVARARHAQRAAVPEELEQHALGEPPRDGDERGHALAAGGRPGHVHVAPVRLRDLLAPAQHDRPAAVARLRGAGVPTPPGHVRGLELLFCGHQNFALPEFRRGEPDNQVFIFLMRNAVNKKNDLFVMSLVSAPPSSSLPRGRSGKPALP